MKVRYCELCNRDVPAKKKFSWPFFIGTLFIGIGILYPFWYMIKPRNICPICGSGGLKPKTT
jgi:hypothetical protein